MGRGKRVKQTGRFIESIAAEKATSGDSDIGYRPKKHRRKPPKIINSSNRFDPLPVDEISDGSDNDFQTGSGSDDTSSSEGSDIEIITNEEVFLLRFFLTSFS
jgi:hypothetical protein